MPTYTYRREDGTTFDIRQKFTDDPLTTDPTTGQKVTRVIQSAGVIFKGSGFYVTDNRTANNPAAPKTGTEGSNGEAASSPDNKTSSDNSTAKKSNADSKKTTAPAASSGDS